MSGETLLLDDVSAMSKRKRPGRPPIGDRPKDRSEDRHAKPRESFYLDDDLRDALVEFIESHDELNRPTKSTCFVVALREFLGKRGFWPRQKSNRREDS